LGARAVRRLAGEAEAAVIEGDAREAVLEVRHLLPPGQVAAPEAVGEYEGRAPAVGLVVEVASRAGEERHRLPSWASEAAARALRDAHKRGAAVARPRRWAALRGGEGSQDTGRDSR